MSTGIIAKPEDILKAKGIIFGGGAGSANAFMFLCAKEMLNMPIERIAMGYSSGGDARAGFMRGEINMSISTIAAYISGIAPDVAKGEFMPFFQSGALDKQGNLVKEPSAPPVPTPEELYKTLYNKSPSGEAWEAYKGMVAAAAHEKMLMLPPGTPDGIVRAYWDAADKMLKDADYRKLADPLLGEGCVTNIGEALDTQFKRDFRMKPEVRTWLLQMLPKYGVSVE